MDYWRAIWCWVIDPNNLTAISTFIIAIFTIVLACVSHRQAKLTKKAINISERALLDLERACVVPEFPVSIGAEWKEWSVLLVVDNVGRSYAILKGVFFRQVPSVDELPPVPPKEGYDEWIYDVVLRTATSFRLPPYCLRSNKGGQVVYGYIRYEDAFRRIWRNYFAVEVWSDQTPERASYTTVGGDIYNAEIQEK